MVLTASIACSTGYSNFNGRSQARLDHVPGAGIRLSAPSLFGATASHQRASPGGARSQVTKGDSCKERRCSDLEPYQTRKDHKRGQAIELSMATIISSQCHEEESLWLLSSLESL